jgi:dihydroxyacid dehydratase/phosphogluconate dehydratase
MKKLALFKSKYKKGILAKYASLVSSASKGAVTDLFE